MTTETLFLARFILSGVFVTLCVSVLSFAIGIAVGLPITFARRSPNAILRAGARIFVGVMRSLPELLVILLFFYGLDMLLIAICAKLGISKPAIDPFTAVSIGLGLQFAAYSSEIFRDAQNAVGNGLIEAGAAIGMRPTMIARRILIPQMFRIATPALGNLFLVLLKASALASVVGLEEITRRALLMAASTHRPFAAYFIAACGFLALTAVAAWAQRFLEAIRRAEG